MKLSLIMISYHSGFYGGPFVPEKDPNVAGNLDLIINQSTNSLYLYPRSLRSTLFCLYIDSNKTIKK